MFWRAATYVLFPPAFRNWIAISGIALGKAITAPRREAAQLPGLSQFDPCVQRDGPSDDPFDFPDEHAKLRH
jgi:hypothetical protein